MSIYCSLKHEDSGIVEILWDGKKPSDKEFLDHAKNEHNTDGSLTVEFTTTGAAYITPEIDHS